MHLPANVPERLVFDVSEPNWQSGKHVVQDGHPQHDKRSSPLARRESPEDFRRTLIRLPLQMPQSLNFLGCQIEDSRAQNALGSELEDPSKLLDRVGHVVGPDGEIAQNQFSLPQFGHQGPTDGRLAVSAVRLPPARIYYSVVSSRYTTSSCPAGSKTIIAIDFCYRHIPCCWSGN
jgi:hypothetical protein